MKSPAKPVAKPASKYCNFLNVVLVLVIGWMVFLYIYHQNAIQIATQHKENEQSLSNIVQQIRTTAAAVAHTHSLTQQTAQPPAASVPDKPAPVDRPAAVSPTTQSVAGSSEEAEFHIAFSTDCTFFQDWQTLLIFHSAVEIKQQGRITRIASGCDDAKKTELAALYKKLYPQYSVHFTPDFKTDGKTKKKYEFYNKPYGVQHWLTHAEPPILSGTIVNIIDPDMILLRPMTAQIRGDPNNIYMNRFNPEVETVPERVQKGTPVAQLYGLGAPWADDRHRHFNRTEICGVGSPCLQTKVVFGEQHFSVGPPYMLERDDWLKLVTAWTQMVPRVYAKYPSLLAEMYAYSMAAAHTELPHFTLHNLMVSNVHADDEGWKWIDALGDNVCEDPVDGVYYPGHNMPAVLHFCQFYRAAEIGFQKRRIKKELFNCDSPMMLELPKDLGTVDYKNRDGEIIKLGKTEAKRNAFMLCTIHKSINKMVAHYKSVMCSKDQFVNLNKTINVVVKGYYR